MGTVVIQGIKFTRADGNTYSAGFALRFAETGGHFNSVVLDDVEVAYASARNVAFDNSSASYDYIEVNNCNFHHAVRWGFSVRGNVEEMLVIDSHFDDNGDINGNWGVGFDADMPAVKNLTIIGGTFNNNSTKGINLCGVTNVKIEGVEASNNAKYPNTAGICLWEWSDTPSTNIEIINCSITDNGWDGIQFGAEGTNQIENVSIIGGQITGNGQRGISFWPTENSTITGLIVEGVDLSGNGVFGILTGTPDAVTATHNWWGDQDPSDNVSGNVNYDPWYDSAAMNHLMSNMRVENITQNTYYNTITDAVNAASPNDIIIVGDGTYQEDNIVISIPLTIQSQNGQSSTTIQAENTGSIFSVVGSAEDVTIEGFTFIGRTPVVGSTSFSSSITATSVSGLIVRNNRFEFIGPVYLTTVSNFVITGNTYIRQYNENAWYKPAGAAPGSYGRANGGEIVALWSGCTGGIVSNNSGHAPGVTIYSNGTSNTIFKENIIVAPNSPVGYGLPRGDDGITDYGLMLQSSTNCQIIDNRFENLVGKHPYPNYNHGKKGAAVFEGESTNTVLTGNTFKDNTIGVEVRYADTYSGTPAVFSNNSFIGNEFSIFNHRFKQLSNIWTIQTALLNVDCTENYWGSPDGPTVVPAPDGGQTWAAFWDLVNGDEFPENAVSDMVLFDPWWANEEMDTLDSNTMYLAGNTYSFTVHAPNSEDGAKASIWGYYVSPAPTPANPNAVTWKSGTYGSGIFDNGYALVTYTVPEDYKNGREFYWEVQATQHPNSGSRTKRWNTKGPWDQFDTFMLNGQTLEIDTYRFDNFSMDRNTAGFQMNSVNGNPPDAYYATVEVIRPWYGNINDYNNALYNNTTLFNKKGFYPGLAANLGYVVEFVASNPSEPSFQQIRVTKPGTDYDITLFGFRHDTQDDPLGFMWETTFYISPITTMAMDYDPATGKFTGHFDDPVPYNTQFCFQPSVYRTTNEADVLFYYSSGGSMDLIFTARLLKPTELYVDVPRELIPGDYTQTYSIKATELHEGLRGVKIDLKVPKADFVQPNVNTDFSLGSAFDTYANKFLMPEMLDDSDPDYYIYTLNGTYGGGFDGIIGKDVELLKVNLTSKGNGYYNTPNGCLIKINPDTVIMKNDQNPPAVIDCAGTTDGLVLIDDEDPNVEIDNIADYPNGMTLQVNGDGVVLPEFDLLYTDNYDLATALWVILSEDDDAPTVPGDFPAGNVVGEVDGDEELIEDWELPAGGLADGTYVLYLLVTDEAGNQYILPWEFTIDTEAPTALTWVECRTTPDANISVDLKWTYDEDNAPAFINIWVLDYADIDGVDSHKYPEYDPTNLIGVGTIINDIDPYDEDGSELGWKLVKRIPVATGLTLDESEWTGMERGYYYFTIYGEAANGQMSNPPATPFFRESISYWPGDVVSEVENEDYDGKVISNDINVLSAAWGTVTAGDNWNPHCDVGPSTDYARRSRPKPDGRIDFEDLMMFSMNYENTDYEWYPRTDVEADPVSITLAYQDLGGMLQVNLYLDGNNGFVAGLDIPVAFGSGLSLQNVEIGDIWPETSLLLHTNENGVVTVSCAAFGAGAVIEGNGLVASLSFALNGHDNSLELQKMTARGWDNSEIEIVGNPTGEVANEDLVNVIPDSSYLGSVHPNPFRGSATLQYGLKEAGSVKLGVYNTRGQLVRNLMSEGKSAGTYQITWDGSDENGVRVSSGIYLFRMETADVIKTQKAMLLK